MILFWFPNRELNKTAKKKRYNKMEGAHLLCHVMTLREKNNKTNEKFVIGSPNVSTKGVERLMGGTGRSALQPMSLNAGLTGLVPSLESKASRQLRSVKRAVGTFKAVSTESGGHLQLRLNLNYSLTC